MTLLRYIYWRGMTSCIVLLCRTELQLEIESCERYSGYSSVLRNQAQIHLLDMINFQWAHMAMRFMFRVAVR